MDKTITMSVLLSDGSIVSTSLKAKNIEIVTSQVPSITFVVNIKENDRDIILFLYTIFTHYVIM